MHLEKDIQNINKVNRSMKDIEEKYLRQLWHIFKFYMFKRTLNVIRNTIDRIYDTYNIKSKEERYIIFLIFNKGIGKYINQAIEII